MLSEAVAQGSFLKEPYHWNWITQRKSSTHDPANTAAWRKPNNHAINHPIPNAQEWRARATRQAPFDWSSGVQSQARNPTFANAAFCEQPSLQSPRCRGGWQRKVFCSETRAHMKRHRMKR
eukprot:4770631-Amphidinium_carterae.1